MGRKEESRRYYEKNKDEINAKRRQKRKNDIEHRKSLNEKNAEWKRQVLNDPEKKFKFNKKNREYQRGRYTTSTAKQSKAAKERDWYHHRQTEESKAHKLEKRRQRGRECTAKLVKELGGKCVVCGLEDHPVVYDFHHIDPSTKEFAISQMAGGIKWERVLAEAKKCALLCAICHRKLHAGMVELNGAKSQ